MPTVPVPAGIGVGAGIPLGVGAGIPLEVPLVLETVAMSVLGANFKLFHVFYKFIIAVTAGVLSIFTSGVVVSTAVFNTSNFA
jgi:hypothetical protein